ncbi:MAG: GH36-type glycosyl hydrolase domain-containing protein [Christensenellales bacterium]|jgi:hypothetical protein
MAFGSGYFGKWIKGEGGLPAYNYTCDQSTDDKAVTQTNTAWKDKRDHTFMFGNDRVVATCSNYGYVQIRQDEGTPKYLTDYYAKNRQYGGGFGYLVSDDKVVSTYYTQGMHREYGACYFKKGIKSDIAEIEQTLFSPYGDDPVVLDRIKVTNTSDSEKKYKWYEYWAGDTYQFTFTQFIAAQITFNTKNVGRMRRSFNKSFLKEFTLYPNGVKKSLKYKKKGLFLRAVNAIVQGFFRKTGRRFYDMKRAYAMDFDPPDTLLISLKGKAKSLIDADKFFGKGGLTSPDYLTGAEGLKGDNPMMALEEEFALKPGQSVTLYYAYMYIPDGFNAEALTDKYINTDIDKLFKDTLNKWLAEGVRVDIAGEDWINRELTWHNAYLRQEMTYSSFYKAHILSQGGHYQYLMGLQGAPRDQLQHSLSYIYSDPVIAKEHILFTLREMSPKGELPYATTGEGLLFSFVMVPSDLQFMLLMYIGEYVLVTGDKDFLNEKYTVYLEDGPVERTVKQGVMLAFKYATEFVGKGPHGLIRMKTGDWNDQAVYGRVPLNQIKTVHKVGESMLNSAIAAYAFDVFAKMLEYAEDKDAAEVSYMWASDIRKAVEKQWNGKWFKRAWMGKKVGWLGDELLWLEVQPWAVISGATDQEKNRILADNIDKLLRTNPNGAQLISHNPDKEERSAGLDRGVLENGGIWPAVNGYLVWALSKIDEEMAWDEWLKNSRAYQAEAYPDIWYGIWSGPDSVNSVYAKYPGRTQNSKNPVTGKREKVFKLTVGVDWEDFPVLNLHAHTWQQYTIFKLLGLEFSNLRMIINPHIPKDKYSVKSRIFSIEKDKGKYSVKYCPLQARKMVVEFVLKNKVSRVTVNNKEVEYTTNDKGNIEFTIEGKIIDFTVEQ